MGLSMSATKQIAENYDAKDTHATSHTILLIRSWCLLTAILGMVLCVTLSPLLNTWMFNSANHTLSIIFLAPIVGLLAIMGGELSILKGTKHLSQLAYLSIYNVIFALIISVPVFYFWREAGIIPSLLIVSLAQIIITCSYSYRLFPLKISLRPSVLQHGIGMVRIGIPFLLAGILGSGAEFAIRSFLSHTASLNEVGLYNAGYMLTFVYAGMVFSAMETDYFPRLSANNKVLENQNNTVNQQIEVTILIVSPMLVSLLIFIPLILPLLYSGKFLPVLGMIQITVLAMYMRAMMLPIAYLPLAKGDSKTYLIMETAYYAIMISLVFLLYPRYGLFGAGLALTISGVAELAMQVLFMRWKYKYAMSAGVIRYGIIQIPIGIAAYSATFIGKSWAYWTLGALLIALSSIVSLSILHSKTHLWQSIIRRFNNKVSH